MSHHEKIQAGGNPYAGVWRNARAFLALAVVAAMVSGNFLVKVEAAAGDLDKTFSADGKKRTIFGPRDEFASDVAVQSDGKIVVAGYTLNSSNRYDFALARHNSDGTLDTTFSDDGKQTTDFSGNDDFSVALAIQSDGKIVVAGYTIMGTTDYDFALARYNVNGSLDTTFSGDGKQITDFGDGSLALSIAIQSNGKIVLCGFSQGISTNNKFALARYNVNGALDRTFSGDGKQTTEFGVDSMASELAIQPNGKIVVAGIAYTSTSDYDFALARYNVNGALDATFSGDGKQTTDFGGDSSSAFSLAIQSDGKIVLVGSTFGTPSSDYDFALARYNVNGSLDDGTVNDQTPHDMFGTGGLVTTDFFSNLDRADAVAIQSDGKIVAAGSAAHGHDLVTYDFALARYNIDGTLDMTFSGDGQQATDIAGGTYDRATGIAIQTGGKIVVAGPVGKRNGNFDFGLARYLGD